MGGWFCVGLGCVKIGCRHFNVSIAIFSRRFENLCCSIARSGRSLVMNEYMSFWILSSGFIICRFSEWNICNMCGSVGKGWGLSIRLLINNFLDSGYCLYKIVLDVDLCW
jgi:hypothetical protein